MSAAANRHDVLILGGGTAGCVLAARLSEDPGRTVCLVEAGPDYGPFDGGGWPPAMTDPRTPSDTHDWEPDGELSLARARVIGGCSAHNACFVVRGHPDDYERWGAPEWSFRELEAYERRAESALRARQPDPEEISPWALAVIDGAAATGVPVLDDFNAPSAGAGRVPVNVAHDARWNTAFAYLDAARGRENLTVLDRALVDRVAFDGTRALGASAIRGERRLELEAGLVILSAGALGSALILLRSGVGPVEHLAEHGVDPVAALPGVGANLQDHFGANIVFRPSEQLEQALAQRDAGGRMLGSGSIVKARSSACEKGLWDLHLVPWSARDTEGLTGRDWRVQLSPYVMSPASRGSVRLRDRDPASHPDVELGYISDPDGGDLAALVDGVALAREIAASAPITELIDDEVAPGADVDDTAAFIRENVRGYFHPAGTCAIGADPATSVVDIGCRVHGLDGLMVCDASVMPVIPRANTNLTTIAIAEKLAAAPPPREAPA